MFGELVIQFRKWMRPNFRRYWGAKFGETSFSEATGSYRTGAFIELGKFLGTPFQFTKEDSEKDSIPEAMFNVFRGYYEFLTNASFYYNMLAPHQKSAIKRGVAMITSLIGTTLALYAAGLMFGSDDDKKKSKWAQHTLFQLSSLQTDLLETTPVGWVVFYNRTKKNPVPAERALFDLANMVYYIGIFPFQSDESRRYQRGAYKGEYKASVYAKKVTPLARQIQNEEHMMNQISYYQMFNPLVSVASTNNSTASHP
jgi:hypothetical protein